MAECFGYILLMCWVHWIDGIKLQYVVHSGVDTQWRGIFGSSL